MDIRGLWANTEINRSLNTKGEGEENKQTKHERVQMIKTKMEEPGVSGHKMWDGETTWGK